jgi:hypothetical protein
MSFYSYWLGVIEQGAAMLLMALVIILNGQGLMKFARLATLFIGNFHVFLMVYIMGVDGGAYYYFAPVIIAPLFFFSPKELGKIIPWVVLTVTLTSVSIFLHPPLAWISSARSIQQCN